MNRKGALTKKHPLSPRALKRANQDMELEIRDAFLHFLSDCRDVVEGKLIKQQLDDDLKFVSAELGRRKAKIGNNNNSET